MNRHLALDHDWDGVLRAVAAGRIDEHLRENPLPVDRLLEAAKLPRADEPYGRQPLHRGDLGEVLLVRWREDTFCSPHDHGAASGIIGLLRGEFVERLWRWRDGDLEVVGERNLTAPTVMKVAAHAIHNMLARGDGVGIHFYVPAISGMNVYDRERRQTLLVSDDCGAWVPGDPTLVLSQQPW